MKEMIKFDMPKNQSSIIKVIGVGGGGSNAVNHMFRQGIKGVDFMICNTDAQAMESSPVPVKIQLGEKGLGAGSMPAVGKEAACQKMEQIREILEKNTQMVFITAGMGGGTGTGAAPVIASIAKELDILTVGIVTLPFTFEGNRRRLQADEGIKELRKYVDTLLIICNDKLRELYGDLKLSEAFNKADDVLTTAARGIAEIITVTGYINVDFEDVKTVMSSSGKAIMGCAQAEGENRAIDAVKAALSSPLLNDNEIEGASDVLLYITSGQEEISMDEVTEITDYIQREAKSQAEIIWGNGYDETLGNNISITLIATGFDADRRATGKDVKIRHTLDGDPVGEVTPKAPPVTEDNPIDIGRIELIQKPSPEKATSTATEETIHQMDHDRYAVLIRKPAPVESPVAEDQVARQAMKNDERTFIFDLAQEAEDDTNIAEAGIESTEKADAGAISGNVTNEQLKSTEEDVKPFEIYIKKPSGGNERTADKAGGNSVTDLKSQERIDRLRSLSMKLRDESTIEALENEPAYIRRKVELKDTPPSGEPKISRYSLYEDDEVNGPEIRSGNSFLH
ncbi:MAG: cell division protein FtsZ, partial [Bacteroidales bacterium]|nr:cell division protein FtsZ [Bacteroidales bacterium]